MLRMQYTIQTRCVGSSATSDYSRFLLLAMAPAPGDLLRLSDLEINNKVQAMYEDGFWYNAYVLDKTGSGANTTVLVHFNGYPKSHRR